MKISFGLVPYGDPTSFLLRTAYEDPARFSLVRRIHINGSEYAGERYVPRSSSVFDIRYFLSLCTRIKEVGLSAVSFSDASVIFESLSANHGIERLYMETGIFEAATPLIYASPITHIHLIHTAPVFVAQWGNTTMTLHSDIQEYPPLGNLPYVIRNAGITHLSLDLHFLANSGMHGVWSLLDDLLSSRSLRCFVGHGQVFRDDIDPLRARKDTRFVILDVPIVVDEHIDEELEGETDFWGDAERIVLRQRATGKLEYGSQSR